MPFNVAQPCRGNMTIQFNPPVTAGFEQNKVSNSVAANGRVSNSSEQGQKIEVAARLSVINKDNIDDANGQQDAVELSNEQIRISSSLGESDIRGNLSPVKAAEIYKKIAQLL